MAILVPRRSGELMLLHQCLASPVKHADAQILGMFPQLSHRTKGLDRIEKFPIRGGFTANFSKPSAEARNRHRITKPPASPAKSAPQTSRKIRGSKSLNSAIRKRRIRPAKSVTCFTTHPLSVYLKPKKQMASAHLPAPKPEEKELALQLHGNYLKRLVAQILRVVLESIKV